MIFYFLNEQIVLIIVLRMNVFFLCVGFCARFRSNLFCFYDLSSDWSNISTNFQAFHVLIWFKIVWYCSVISLIVSDGICFVYQMYFVLSNDDGVTTNFTIKIEIQFINVKSRVHFRRIWLVKTRFSKPPLSGKCSDVSYSESGRLFRETLTLASYLAHLKLVIMSAEFAQVIFSQRPLSSGYIKHQIMLVYW